MMKKTLLLVAALTTGFAAGHSARFEIARAEAKKKKPDSGECSCLSKGKCLCSCHPEHNATCTPGGIYRQDGCPGECKARP